MSNTRCKPRIVVAMITCMLYNTYIQEVHARLEVALVPM